MSFLRAKVDGGKAWIGDQHLSRLKPPSFHRALQPLCTSTEHQTWPGHSQAPTGQSSKGSRQVLLRRPGLYLTLQLRLPAVEDNRMGHRPVRGGTCVSTQRHAGHGEPSRGPCSSCQRPCLAPRLLSLHHAVHVLQCQWPPQPPLMPPVTSRTSPRHKSVALHSTLV